MAGSRNWCFTLFNYVWENIVFLLSIQCRGIIFQEEMCPTTNMPHLQGFIRFDRAMELQRIKALLGPEYNHIHLEPSVSPSAAVEYCRKGETRMGECYEEGDLIFEQGKSSALEDCYEAVRNGSSYRQLVEEFGIQCILHARGIQFAKFWLDTPTNFRKLNNLAITGHSDVGKTRAVYESFPRVYKLDRSASSGSIWFDGYDGEETLLIDDFYGWIPYGQLLNILDGYPLRLDIKGAHTWAKWTSVIITSNKSPHLWYHKEYTSGCTPALARRLHHWLTVDEHTTLEEISTFLTVKPNPYGPPIGREYSATSINWVEPAGVVDPSRRNGTNVPFSAPTNGTVPSSQPSCNPTQLVDQRGFDVDLTGDDDEYSTGRDHFSWTFPKT